MPWSQNINLFHQTLINFKSATNSAAKDMPVSKKSVNFFTNDLEQCLTDISNEKGEKEPTQRTTLNSEFLSKVFPNNKIRGAENIDLSIFNRKTNNVGVIIEYKKPTNKPEMVSPTDIKAKGLLELIQYYLDQLINQHNDNVKCGIVTNGFSWYFISSASLYHFFGEKKELRKAYKEWSKDQMSSKTTEFLRTEVVLPAVNKALNNGLSIGYLNLKDVFRPGTYIIKPSQRSNVFRFLSPQNLLREGITHYHGLNKQFYNELLYLMGLHESSKNRSKIIKRLPKNQQQHGSLMEMILTRLNENDPQLSSKDKKDIALQLSVTWVNRFLFLKLLEAQLVAFNEDSRYQFLTNANLHDMNDVYDLFFPSLS